MIHSPLAVILPRKKVKDKRFILNLNNYRNAYYQVLNEAKKEYKRVIEPQIMALPIFTKVSVIFTLYPKTRRRTDIANVCSIHDKFFADALVEYGKLADDDYTRWSESRYLFGKVDKKCPRVDIVLRELVIK